jgi:hypothetical protein
VIGPPATRRAGALGADCFAHLLEIKQQRFRDRCIQVIKLAVDFDAPQFCL